MSHRDPSDAACGYDALADEFARRRTPSLIGAASVRRWASTLPAGAEVLDAGCGTGLPVTRALLDAGCRVHAIDASVRMTELFRQNFPDVPVAAEPIEASTFFGRQFDAVLSWGVLFLMEEAAQPVSIARLASALRPEGRLLFTAPWQAGSWTDVLTRRPSWSLGREAYVAAMEAAGLVLIGEWEDEGSNHYYEARRVGAPA